MACVPDACLVGRLRVWGWNRGEGRLASYLPATGDEASRVGWGRGTRVLPLPVARRRRSLGRDGIYQSWNGDGEWYLGPALFRVTIGPELVEQIKLIVPASMRFMRVASFTVFKLYWYSSLDWSVVDRFVRAVQCLLGKATGKGRRGQGKTPQDYSYRGEVWKFGGLACVFGGILLTPISLVG